MARQAVDIARAAHQMSPARVELADEPVQPDRSWISAYQIDLFTVPDAEKVGLQGAIPAGFFDQPGVDHVTARLDQVLKASSTPTRQAP